MAETDSNRKLMIRNADTLGSIIFPELQIELKSILFI